MPVHLGETGDQELPPPVDLDRILGQRGRRCGTDRDDPVVLHDDDLVGQHSIAVHRDHVHADECANGIRRGLTGIGRRVDAGGKGEKERKGEGREAAAHVALHFEGIEEPGAPGRTGEIRYRAWDRSRGEGRKGSRAARRRAARAESGSPFQRPTIAIDPGSLQASRRETSACGAERPGSGGEEPAPSFPTA